MSSRSDYPQANRRRLEGHDLAINVVHEIKGLLLAHAFTVVRSAGFCLRINKLDGLTHSLIEVKDGNTINVNVSNGIIQKSWCS